MVTGPTPCDPVRSQGSVQAALADTTTLEPPSAPQKHHLTSVLVVRE